MNLEQAKNNWLQSSQIFALALEQKGLRHQGSTILQGTLATSILSNVNPDIRLITDISIVHMLQFANELRLLLLKIQRMKNNEL